MREAVNTFRSVLEETFGPELAAEAFGIIERLATHPRCVEALHRLMPLLTTYLPAALAQFQAAAAAVTAVPTAAEHVLYICPRCMGTLPLCCTCPREVQ